MNEDFSTALTLLAVGMITVFTILLLLVLLGNLLINIVNRYFPAAEKPAVAQRPPVPLQTSARPAETSHPPPGQLHPHVLAAILAAVSTATKGTGRVTRIEKTS